MGSLNGHDCVLDFDDQAAEFAALRDSFGVVDFNNRTQIELAGRDSAAFLHNLCTNDIKSLTPGDGCEVFLTNVQGKIIGHGYVYRTSESCIYETIPSVGAELLSYFDRYLFREQVELIDRSKDRAVLVIAGKGTLDVLNNLGLPVPAELFAHATGELSPASGSSLPCAIRNADLVAEPCFQLSIPRKSIPIAWETLTAAGALPCGSLAWEQARILQGTPVYDIDVTDENLPQEVDRNERTISFTKGCYIGQETVARIDALGHVNKTLCKLQIDGRVPTAGEELYVTDDVEQKKVVGKLTSVAPWPDSAKREDETEWHAIGLGYVRRGSNMPGTNLAGEGFAAAVVR